MSKITCLLIHWMCQEKNVKGAYKVADGDEKHREAYNIDITPDDLLDLARN